MSTYLQELTQPICLKFPALVPASAANAIERACKQDLLTDCIQLRALFESYACLSSIELFETYRIEPPPRIHYNSFGSWIVRHHHVEGLRGCLGAGVIKPYGEDCLPLLKWQALYNRVTRKQDSKPR